MVEKDVFNLLASLTRIQKVHDAPMSQYPHSFDARQSISKTAISPNCEVADIV